MATLRGVRSPALVKSLPPASSYNLFSPTPFPLFLMSYEIDNPLIQKLLKETGMQIHSAMPTGWCFTLFMFNVDRNDPSMFYLSDAQRDGMMHTLREFLAKQDMEQGMADAIMTNDAVRAVATEILTGIGYLQGSPTFRYESAILIDCANRMIERGESFVKLLGDMYFRCDGANQQKILCTWSLYFLQYAQ